MSYTKKLEAKKISAITDFTNCDDVSKIILEMTKYKELCMKELLQIHGAQFYRYETNTVYLNDIYQNMNYISIKSNHKTKTTYTYRLNTENKFDVEKVFTAARHEIVEMHEAYEFYRFTNQIAIKEKNGKIRINIIDVHV